MSKLCNKLEISKYSSSFQIFLAQTPYNGAPVQNPVPDQTQAAFAPNPTNQYPANPAPFHSADPNMAMNAMAKNTIPDAETQVSLKKERERERVHEN